MATAGPSNPSSSTGSTWTNPTAAYSSNDTYATNALSSYFLYLMGYGFAIPAGSTIDGITVAVERKASVNSKFEFVVDNNVQLLIDGSAAGNDKKDAVTKWPTTDTSKTYGGVADLWGLTPTVDQVNASNFGVQLQVTCSATASVDVITITITYTEGGGGASAVPVIIRSYRQRLT